MDSSNAQLVGVLFGGVNLLLTTILLWVVADLRARIHRLENFRMKGD